MTHIKKNGSFLCKADKGPTAWLFKKYNHISSADFIKQGHRIDSRKICKECLEIQNKRFQRTLTIV